MSARDEMRARVPLRIHVIADMFTKCAVAADIGCDHGYLCFALLDGAKAMRTIACDVSSCSLEKASRLLLATFSPDRFDIRLAFGLDAIGPGEADEIAICGIGAHEIMAILTKGARTAQSASGLILAPQHGPERLREFLTSNGYEIEAERIAEQDGRFYPIMRAAFSPEAQQNADPFWLYFGRRLLDDPSPVLTRYMEHEIVRMRGILRELSAHGRASNDREVKVFAERVERLERLKEENCALEPQGLSGNASSNEGYL